MINGHVLEVERLCVHNVFVMSSMRLYVACFAFVSAALILVCLKMICNCPLFPIKWELAKNEGHSVKLQTILH